MFTYVYDNSDHVHSSRLLDADMSLPLSKLDKLEKLDIIECNICQHDTINLRRSMLAYLSLWIKMVVQVSVSTANLPLLTVHVLKSLLNRSVKP